MSKRIVLLLDGTWNDADFGNSDTNIVRLRESIARSLDTVLPAAESTKGNTERGQLSSTASVNFRQGDYVVFYERGVGTGAFMDRWVGGAFGEGITQNIRRAYKFLSFHYLPGDQIFVFAFSRGAYTARSLIGYIHATGLLTREYCTEDREQDAWDFYRCPPNDRLPGIWTALTPYVHNRDTTRVACVAVFDTVGALGVPLAPFRVANRDKYEFHDVELSSITDTNLQALAVDEHREPFEATVWRRSKFKRLDTVTEQVWFPGSHADIGGGYIDEASRADRPEGFLDDISLDWMIRRIRHYYQDFPIDESDLSATKNDQLNLAQAPQHNSRKGIYRLMPKAWRSISNTPVGCRSARFFRALGEVNVGYDRHQIAEGEMMHISVLQRFGKNIMVDGKTEAYTPRNVADALQRMAQYYNRMADKVEIKAVGWDGNVIRPGTPEAQIVISLLDKFL
jgi:hypothetical protein